MLVDTTGELIDLAWAYEQALGYYTMKTAPMFYQGCVTWMERMWGVMV